MPEMRQSDIVPCSACGKGLMHEGIPIFYQFRMDTMGIDAQAVQRQTGLEMVLGGHAAIAHAMGPDEVIAAEIDTKEVTLCHSCMMNCNAGSFIGG